MFSGLMKVKLKMGMTCDEIFHAGYFIRCAAAMDK